MSCTNLFSKMVLKRYLPVMLCMLILTVIVCRGAAVAFAEQSFGFGLTRSIFGEINKNDALAAIKVWTSEIVAIEGISIAPRPRLFSDIRNLEAALENKTIDGVAITVPEYAKVVPYLKQDFFLLGSRHKSYTEEYILLVHRENPASDIGDLAGHTLLELQANATTSLTKIWLDVELGRAGLPKADIFFSNLTRVNNLNRAVLPVFFQKADACLVTRNGFDTMAELNPQLSKQLKVLATSEPYVPMLFAFRNDYDADFKRALEKRFDNWPNTPVGRQLLNIFQVDSLTRQPAGCIDKTLELLRKYQQLYSGS